MSWARTSITDGDLRGPVDNQTSGGAAGPRRAGAVRRASLAATSRLPSSARIRSARRVAAAGASPNCGATVQACRPVSVDGPQAAVRTVNRCMVSTAAAAASRPGRSGAAMVTRSAPGICSMTIPTPPFSISSRSTSVMAGGCGRLLAGQRPPHPGHQVIDLAGLPGGPGGRTWPPGRPLRSTRSSSSRVGESRMRRPSPRWSPDRRGRVWPRCRPAAGGAGSAFDDQCDVRPVDSPSAAARRPTSSAPATE